MPESSLTPEEKLLRIIESTPSSGGRGQGAQRPAQDLKARFGIFKAVYSETARKFFNLKIINAVLVTFCASATIFLILDYVFGAPRVAAVLELEASAKQSGVGDLTIGGLGSEARFVKEITDNNIFALPEPETGDSDSEESISSEVLTNTIKQYKVVGIIWSKAPQAIVENVSTGKTQLINRGSSLAEARVKAITRNSVVLSCGSQELELK